MPRQVLAFYYTWYGSPQVSGNWHHWDEGGHAPNEVNEDGYPDIGAANHPSHGLYDSNDPLVIQRQLKWCAEAGIDGLIATWWGQGRFHDTALKIALEKAAASSTKLSVYYEIVPQSGIAGVVDDLRYILTHYGRHPGFFVFDGKPVIFVYGRAIKQLSAEQWDQVVRQIRQEHQVVLIADTDAADLIRLFDGGHTYNPVEQVVQQADMAALYQQLVQLCRQAGKIACATVIPGYDDSNISRQKILVAHRRGGQLYKTLWAQAEQSCPDWMLITSFNEWHEGSEIEPSIEHGKLYLQLTRQLVRDFKSAD